MNPELEQIKVFDRLNELVKTYHSALAEGSFVEYHPPEALTEIINPAAPSDPLNWDQLFKWVEDYLRYSLKTNHPKFVNRMWSGANLPSVVGEIITAVTNTSACTYESAPVSTVIEKYMINEMLDLVGFKNGEGQMTTGSSNANMIAMMAARDRVNRDAKQKGLFGSRELFAYVGVDSHYSMDKAAALLGIGTDHLIKVPLDEQGRMQLDFLEKSIATIQKQGSIPFFVGATAGTTVRGAYDPIEDLLKLRQKYDFWLHVDGAWGGAAVLSPKTRVQYLSGIGEVDSFTFDFHKMPGTNLVCNVLLLNEHPGALRQSCSIGDASYIFREESEKEEYNLGSFSLQCGRRVDALKWFLDWKFFGQKGFARRIEHYLQLSKYAERLVEETPELEMVVPRESFNTCFRFKTPYGVSSNDFNLKLRTRLYRDAVNLVGFGYIGSDLCLRLLITNPVSTKDTVRSFFRDVVQSGKALLEEI